MFKGLLFPVALLAAQAMAALPADCNPPGSPEDSTYGICAYPLNDAATSNTAAVDTYLTSHCGCKTISGNGAGVITGLRCGGPGPEVITQGVSGWGIKSQFNPAGCPPGSNCA